MCRNYAHDRHSPEIVKITRARAAAAGLYSTRKGANYQRGVGPMDVSALNEQRLCDMSAKTGAREIVDKAREARPRQEKEKGEMRKEGRKEGRGRDRREGRQRPDMKGRICWRCGGVCARIQRLQQVMTCSWSGRRGARTMERKLGTRKA